jgi:hypothetical protein
VALQEVLANAGGRKMCCLANAGDCVSAVSGVEDGEQGKCSNERVGSKGRLRRVVVQVRVRR